MSLFGSMSPGKAEQLISWLEREHPTIKSIEIKPLFGSGVYIEMGKYPLMSRVRHKKESQLEAVPQKEENKNTPTSQPKSPPAPPREEKKIPNQESDVAVPDLEEEQEASVSEKGFFYVKYPWKRYRFRMLRASIGLIVGKHIVDCMLEPIVAPCGGRFFLGKTYDETGKKKRGLRSGDHVATGDTLGMIVHREKDKQLPSREWIVAKTAGHLDIPQGIDWASVKADDTLMLIVVTKSDR